MTWLGLIALATAILVVRRVIMWRWRTYRLSHRQAAGLLAAVMPLILVTAFVVDGIRDLGRLLLVLAFALFFFGSSYVFTEFALRWFGGEMDPPSSSSYRRRP